MCRRGHPAWVALICAIHLRQAGAVVYNTSSPEDCSVPTLPPEPRIPECAPNASATLQEAIARAWEFAPVVHTHILEPWHLQDPALFWNNSELYLSDGLPAGNSSFDFMLDDPAEFVMLSPKSYVTMINNTALTPAEIEGILGGAPFDAANRSTAKVAFTVVEDPPNFFTYNFNLFYSWNGCSNQAITLTLDGKKNVTNYVMCPPDVHEGDWERVSVLVCKSDWGVKRMAFSQHAWAQERDCTVPGECTVDPETGHFSTFAGLYSHANYPHPSPLWVYAFLNGTITANISLTNLNGLYIADRTEPDPYRKWVPRTELLTYIPPLGEQGNASASRWTRYAGNWGAPLALPTISLTCFNDAQNETFPCPPEDEATTLILQVAKLVKSLPLPVVGELGGTGESYTAKSVDNATTVGWPGITGPLTRAFSYEWYPQPTPLIQKSNLGTLMCPWDVPAGKDMPSVAPGEFTASTTTLTNYIVGVAVGDICFSLALVLILCLPALMDRTARVQRLMARGVGAAGRAARHAASGIGRGAAAVDAALPGQAARGEVAGAVGYGVDAVGQGVGAVERGAAAVLGPFKPGTSGAVALADEGGRAPLPPPAPRTSSFSSDVYGASPMAATGSSYVALEEVELTPEEKWRHKARWAAWFILGAGMFIPGMVLSIMGVVAIFTDSIVAAALDKLNASSVGQTIYALLISLLCIIATFDLVVLYVLYLMEPARLEVGRWSVRNRLGGWRWAKERAWQIYVASTGLMVLVVNICALLFALGFVITIVQVMTRIACSRALDTTFFGESVLALCISVPWVAQGGEICGWEILELCANVTNLNVRYLMFGAMLLTWCHLIWLISMIFLLHDHRQKEVYIKSAQSGLPKGASGEGAAAE